MIDYTAAARTYDHTRTHSDRVLDAFVARVPLGPGVSVLDFGCGTGNYLSAISHRFGCECHGVEPSEGMRARALEKPGGLDVVEGSHNRIPFAADRFDFAYMTDVVHHVPDLDAMFAELQRVLKPGAWLCIVTESHAQIESRFYNQYFPSLAINEKRRYPDVPRIAASALAAGWEAGPVEAVPYPPREVNEQFVRNVAEKNWSMFRLLSDDEYAAGLKRVTADLGRTFGPSAAGESFVWFRKPAGRSVASA